jgi:hypothetical protein
MLSLVAVTACGFSSLSLAESPFTPGLARIALGQAILNNGRRAVESATAAALAAANSGARESPGSAEVPLTYDPDPRLSEWTRVSMIDTLSQNDPEVRQRMERAFANNTVLEDFDRFMSSRGYSSRDVSDDMAELLLVSWRIITGVTATDAQTRGVHAQTRALFLANPQVRDLTNADRQLMGERIAYQVMISSSANQQYLHGGDQSQRAQLRESAAAMMRREGIDPQQLHLTDRGFVR